MGLNVARYRHAGETRWGVVLDGGIAPIPGVFAGTGDFLRDGRAEAWAMVARGTRAALRERDVEILSPVTPNQQFVCQGVNYRDHAAEAGLDPEDRRFNMIFRKASSCLAPPNTDIVRPAAARLLDYEIELGVVIGCAITGPVPVTDASLHEFVAGVVLTNDISARDIQLPEVQFYKGKSYRTFGPTGPYLHLLEREDVPRLRSMRMTLKVNGETRQNASTCDMIYHPAETLRELSGVMDLFPGDLLATGTPSGVALRVPGRAAMVIANLLPDRARWKLFLKGQSRNPRYLKPGDVIESTIRSEDGKIDLGVQRNRVVADSAG